MSRPWAGIVHPREIELYETAGLGRRGALGQHPALVLIDVQYRTVGEPVPITDAMKQYPAACGEVAWAAISHATRVLEAARQRGIPVFYPYVAPKESYDSGRLAEKTPAFMVSDARGYEFVAEVAPQPGDVLIPKRHPSAFFGTPFASYLIAAGIDTLLVCGATTSGCVRATVVDAFSYNFRVAVVQECVYDRAQVTHAVNLFDMQSKYADVIGVDEAIAYLTGGKS